MTPSTRFAYTTFGLVLAYRLNQIRCQAILLNDFFIPASCFVISPFLHGKVRLQCFTGRAVGQARDRFQIAFYTGQSVKLEIKIGLENTEVGPRAELSDGASTHTVNEEFWLL